MLDTECIWNTRSTTRQGTGAGTPERLEREDTEGENGEVMIEVPPDRAGTFEPQFRQRAPDAVRRIRRKASLDVRTRDDAARHSGASGTIYGVEVSPTLISNVTDGVAEDVKA